MCFLGLSVTSKRGDTKIRIHSKSIKRFKERVRELTDRNSGRSIHQIIYDLNLFLRGWWNYYSISQCNSMFRSINGWIMRRLNLLWQEYKEQYPDGYQYSWYCHTYREWAAKLDVVMRHEHRAGEKMFVDYAGQTVDVIDQETGEIHKTQIFVAVLGASSYTYAEATYSQKVEDWIGSHTRLKPFLLESRSSTLDSAFIVYNLFHNTSLHSISTYWHFRSFDYPIVGR